MGINTTGYACCQHCGAEYRLFTIFNRDMQGLCKVWKQRHERTCAKKTPMQRRWWARKYQGKDQWDSALTVDMNHKGFKEEPIMSYDQLLQTVKDYWADQSRSASETKADLGALIDEIEVLRDTLPDSDCA
ncbi:hypothetical protein ACQUKI_20850 [Ralstonia pseudosolanacearum]